MSKSSLSKYCDNYLSYSRLKTREVLVGNIIIGGNEPIRLQSMSNCNPMNTGCNVEQSIRIIEAGGELVRFTAPTTKHAENLKNISEELKKRHFLTPLVADIHFSPKAALVAANYVEKVRINPGNYAEKDKKKTNYSEREYLEALNYIESEFIQLIELCKKNKVAIRIGSNHGSLSQRIMDKYGDTPVGMVEAAMEYLRIAIKHDFYNIVLSMKASNIRVMVQAYRLLVANMKAEGMLFPLHLGVTEAGEGEDGRIKSAAGIGALLEDGIGDTIRVSLTEDPELEIPVARSIAQIYNNVCPSGINDVEELPYNPFEYAERTNKYVLGKYQMPVVGYDFSFDEEHRLYDIDEFINLNSKPKVAAVEVCYDDFVSNKIDKLDKNTDITLVFIDKNIRSTHYFRSMFIDLINKNIDFPVIIKRSYKDISEDNLLINSAIDFGALLVDGLGDGIWIDVDDNFLKENINKIALGILQACRCRISKTEYISCPSCGRTNYNIQAAVAELRAKTDHLKGLKIAVMGCIVNGPGEMADADYGYVGAGIDKITLYKGKEIIEKNIPQDIALDKLIEIIKINGDWKEKSQH